MAQLLDGRVVSRIIREQVALDVSNLQKIGREVKLAIIIANDDPSSLSYVNAIVKAGEKTGINILLEKPNEINQANLEMIVGNLSRDTSIHGIMLQTPLPDYIDTAKLSALIPVEKDIDGLSPLSAGRLAQGLDCFAPATAQAVMEIIKYYEISLAGKNAVVVGRSNIVGKPVAQLFLAQNATISICHSKTKDIGLYAKSSDVMVVAIGKSQYITKEFAHENLTVIDVGTNFDDTGKMTGDVDFQNVEPAVQAITPVPGGVGPVTTAVLLKHACESANKSL